MNLYSNIPERDLEIIRVNSKIDCWVWFCGLKPALRDSCVVEGYLGGHSFPYLNLITVLSDHLYQSRQEVRQSMR